MQEKSGYRKRLEKDLFYSYEAPFIIFSDYALDIICEKYNIGRKDMRLLAAVRLFMKIRQFARPPQLIKLLKRDKFYVSKMLKQNTENGLLERVQADVVRRFYGRKKVSNNKAYYRLSPQGRKLIKEFNKVLIGLIREFDDDRDNHEYSFIKINEQGRAE